MGGFVEVWGTQGPALVELTAERTTMGRSATNGIVLEVDPTVSRLHAVIERYETGYCVRDLGSANGTFVNGERVVAEVRLRSGDEVRLGESRLTFYSFGDAEMETTLSTEGPPVLTRRERDVLVALCKPMFGSKAFNPPASIKDLARELVVSEAAVKFHLANLYDKFAIHDSGSSRRVQLANEALRRRAVSMADLREPHR